MNFKLRFKQHIKRKERMALLPDFPPHYRLLRRPRARRGRHNNGSSGSDSNVMGHPSSESTVLPCGAPPSPSELAVKSSAGLGLVLSLKKIIGEGTTARVVAAREVKTRKAYAIKCIDLTTKSGKCVAENEVGAMKSLGSHPNVWFRRWPNSRLINLCAS